MKKTATKFSGVLTLIFSIFLLLIAGLQLLASRMELEFVVEIENSSAIVGAIFAYVYGIFTFMPATLVGSLVTSLDFETLDLIFSIVPVVFSLFMIFCGIKEIMIAKRDDEGFAHCKKTCWFFAVIKFIFLAYMLFLIVGEFLIDDVKLLLAFLEFAIAIMLNFDNAILILNSVVAVIALLLFLLPVINVCHVAKQVKKNGGSEQPMEYNNQNGMQANNPNGYQQNPGQTYQAAPQPTMQANMPPMQGYTNVAQPVQQNVQPQAPAAQPVNPTVNAGAQPAMANPAMQQPGANSQEQPILNAAGQPLSEKGQADLSRLERLKAMGSITEENYEVMKRKILEDN